MFRWGTAMVVALLVLIPWSCVAHAETDDEPLPKWGDRTLAGHTFIAPQIAPSGFVTTHVGIRQGVLFRRVPDYPLGPFGSLTLMQVGADEFLDLGLKLSDHVGLYGNLHLTIHAGMNAESKRVTTSPCEAQFSAKCPDSSHPSPTLPSSHRQRHAGLLLRPYRF